MLCGRWEFVHDQNPGHRGGRRLSPSRQDLSLESGILTAKRAIEPRNGLWTLRAGQHGTGRDDRAGGAAVRPRKRACATIEIDRLLAMYTWRASARGKSCIARVW